MAEQGNTQQALNDTAKSGAQAVGTAKTAYKVGKNTAKAGKAAMPLLKLIFTNPYVLAAIAIVILLCILAGATSSAELSGTFYLSNNKNSHNVYKPSEEKRTAAIWDKNVISETQNKLLSKIADAKEPNYDDKIEKIKNDCIANGWDYDLTIGQLTRYSSSDNTLELVKGNTEDDTQVLKNYDLTEYRKVQLTTFKYKDLKNKSWPDGSKQSDIMKSKKVTYDRDGLAIYKGKNGDDYLIILPDEYGNVGDRFRIKFKNGAVASCYLMKTTEENDDLLQFYTDPSKLEETVKEENNLAKLYSKKFDEITSIEKIKGKIKTKEIIRASVMDTNILAAYSVSIDNSQLIKVERELGGGRTQTSYKTMDGRTIEIKTKGNGEIDYEKDLEWRLGKYDGDFYELSYEMDDGEIKVYTEEHINTIPIVDSMTGETTYREEIIYKYYAVPIIVEKDVNEIGEEIFNIDPSADYLYEDSGITKGEAITLLGETTYNLLYDAYDMSSSGYRYSSSSGTYVPTKLEGKYIWPCQNTIITSDFGPRVAPTAGASTDHKGIDIGACYEPIFAVADGTITYAGWYGGYGNYIEMETTDCRIVFGHLSVIKVRNGQKVTQGQQIAVSGNTGTSTGPHLHIEVHEKGGSELDPVRVLVKPSS